MLSFVLLAHVQTVTAATYYVDAISGNDNNTGLTPATAWRSLNRVNAAAFLPGDRTLFKRTQSWTGRLIVVRHGTAAARITYGAYGDGPKPIINGVAGVDSAIVFFDADYVTLQDLDVRGPVSMAILVQGSQYPIIEACDVGWGSPGWGIRATGRYSPRPTTDYGVIRRCRIDSGRRAPVGVGTVDGIQLTDGVTHWDIYDNIIRAFPHAGVSISQLFDQEETAYNRVYRNCIEAAGIDFMRGFELYGDQGKTHHNDVFFNYIKNTTVASHTNGHHNRICYNIVDTVINPSGYTDDNAFDLAIWPNAVTGTRNYVCHDNQIFNNVIYNTCHPGIMVIGTVNGALNLVRFNQICNNVLLGTHGGIGVNNCCSAGFNTFSNNLIFGVDPVYVVAYLGYLMSVNAFNSFNGTAGDTITGNIQLDPLLANPVAGGFNPQVGSPVIDAGLPLGLSQDYAGTPVPQGNAPDIGAFEFAPRVFGDLDGDNDVDLNDLTILVNCMTGANVPTGSGCGAADLDEGCDVDLNDFAGFELAFTGD